MQAKIRIHLRKWPVGGRDIHEWEGYDRRWFWSVLWPNNQFDNIWQFQYNSFYQEWLEFSVCFGEVSHYCHQEWMQEKYWVDSVPSMHPKYVYHSLCLHKFFKSPSPLHFCLRRDRYEKHLHVYWVESQMAGRRLTLSCIYCWLIVVSDENTKGKYRFIVALYVLLMWTTQEKETRNLGWRRRSWSCWLVSQLWRLYPPRLGPSGGQHRPDFIRHSLCDV